MVKEFGIDLVSPLLTDGTKLERSGRVNSDDVLDDVCTMCANALVSRTRSRIINPAGHCPGIRLTTDMSLGIFLSCADCSGGAVVRVLVVSEDNDKGRRKRQVGRR
jgi:hypothetical protein